MYGCCWFDVLSRVCQFKRKLVFTLRSTVLLSDQGVVYTWGNVWIEPHETKGSLVGKRVVRVAAGPKISAAVDST